MAINSVNLFSVFQQKGVTQGNSSAQTSQKNSNPLISLNQNQTGDTFTKTQNNSNQVKTPSGALVSKEDNDKMKARENAVKLHEQAHQAAGGSLAGAPSYEYNEYGYIQNGHVNISVPGVNKEDPELSKSQAETVKRSALAPSDELSDADLSVAAKAESVIKESEKLISEKNAEKTQGNNQEGQGTEKKQTSTNPFA